MISPQSVMCFPVVAHPAMIAAVVASKAQTSKDLWFVPFCISWLDLFARTFAGNKHCSADNMALPSIEYYQSDYPNLAVADSGSMVFSRVTKVRLWPVAVLAYPTTHQGDKPLRVRTRSGNDLFNGMVSQVSEKSLSYLPGLGI